MTTTSHALGTRWHGVRVARRLLVPLAFTIGWVDASMAQQNAPTVGPIALAALNKFCNKFDNVPGVCSLANASPAQGSQLAPDKLVMQSRAAQVLIDQQAAGVRDRLCELRDAQLGSSLCKRDAQRASSSTTPVSTSLKRVSEDAAPGSWAFSTMLLRPLQTRQSLASNASNGGSTVLAQAADTGSAQADGGGAIATNALGLYFRAQGRIDRSDATNFDPGFRSRSTGLTVGADYLLGASGVVGASASYDSNRSALATGDGTPSGNVSTRGGGLSLYSAYYPAPTAYIDATLLYSHNRYSSTRNISTALLTDSALGETNSNQYGVDLGAGYSLQSARFNYGPYARVKFSRTRVEAFTEQPNASSSNLSVAEQQVNSLISTIGAQVSYSASQGWGVLVPSARLEWEHQYKEDRTKSILANFAGDTRVPPPAIMVIDTTPPDRNYFNLGLGLAAHFGVGRSAYIYYQTVLGRSGQTSHAVTAELRLEL